MISPLRNKIFRYPKFSETQKGSHSEGFQHCSTKKVIGKLWYSSLLIQKIFRYRKNSDNRNRMIPLRSFSVLRGKKNLTENCDTCSLTPLLIQKIHRNSKFCEEQKGSSTKVFGIFRQKIFSGKLWYSPLFIQKLSRYRIVSETQHRRIPLRILSALRDWKILTEKRDTLFLPTLLSEKLIDFRIFLKHRRVRLRNLSALWDNNFSVENCDITS